MGCFRGGMPASSPAVSKGPHGPECARCQSWTLNCDLPGSRAIPAYPPTGEITMNNKPFRRTTRATSLQFSVLAAALLAAFAAAPALRRGSAT